MIILKIFIHQALHVFHAYLFTLQVGEKLLYYLRGATLGELQLLAIRTRDIFSGTY